MIGPGTRGTHSKDYSSFDSSSFVGALVFVNDLNEKQYSQPGTFRSFQRKQTVGLDLPAVNDSYYH